MGIKYIWDTNTAIYFLQEQLPDSAKKSILITLKHSKPAISAITEIELLCWKSASPKDLEVLRDFISEAHVFELERDIKLQTAEVRKSHRIKLPDAIIAATALVHGLVLITRNVKDFRAIEGLELLDPFEM